MERDGNKLPEKFEGTGEVKGYTFTRIRTSKLASIYEVSGGSSPRWEVFKRKMNKRFNVESYPNANAFGKRAFTTHNREEADRIYERLCKEEKLRLKKQKK